MTHIDKVANKYFNLLGQGSSLHAAVSSAGPNPWSTQVCPPLEGEGLVQLLVRFFTPPSQVLLQALHSDQSVYPPASRHEHHVNNHLFNTHFYGIF